jgi:hypothetical protein
MTERSQSLTPMAAQQVWQMRTQAEDIVDTELELTLAVCTRQLCITVTKYLR